jgi:23S rRNA pseudouridine1911/1915/1917 synthase
MREEIPVALDGERLDRVVSMLTGASRALVAELISAGEVLVDDIAVTQRSRRVRTGEIVAAPDAPEPPDTTPLPDPSIEYRLVYEDADLLVIDKPDGLVVHPGSGNMTGTLVNGLLARYPEIATVGDPARPGIVHRLDKGTSGLLLVARSDAAYERLAEMMQDHEVQRRYRALVWGWPDPPSGVVDAPIGRSDRDPLRMAVRADGRPARTHFHVSATFNEPVAIAELECELETGRTHQIRVHLAAIGHPVLGDTRYGGQRTSLPFTRPWLHAEKLDLAHPVTNEPLTFESPLPADLVESRDRLSLR